MSFMNIITIIIIIFENRNMNFMGWGDKKETLSLRETPLYDKCFQMLVFSDQNFDA